MCLRRLLAEVEGEARAKEQAARHAHEEAAQQHELALSTTTLMLESNQKAAVAEAVAAAHDAAQLAGASPHACCISVPCFP